MENNFQPNGENQNLIAKLTEKLKQLGISTKCMLKKVWNFTKEKCIPLALALNILLTPVTLASCNNGNSTDSSTDSSYSETNTDSSTNSGTDSSTDTNTPSKPDYSKYSSVLRTVLQDSYYNDLIAKDKEHLKNNEYYSYDNPEFESIPYGFLEDEGFNISKIKNKTIDAKSDVYRMGNDLFVEVKVENQTSNPYYSSYLLKYELTNKEMSDLNLIFESLDSNIKKTYYQAPFFIQELSYQKEAEILYSGNINKDTLTSAEEFFAKKDFLPNKVTCTYLGGEEVSSSVAHNYFNVHMGYSRTSTINEIDVWQIRLYCRSNSLTNENGVIVYKSTIGGGSLLRDQDIEDAKNSVTKATAYSCDKTYFTDFKTAVESEKQVN